MTRKTASTKTKRTRAERALATKMMRQLRAGADARSRQARRLRAAIRADRYENNLKLQIALDRLLAELASARSLL